MRNRKQPELPSDVQAAEFITAMHKTGWRSINCFLDGGHTFELLSKGAKTILVQMYPGGHGFEVWRPITESATIAETAAAVGRYGAVQSLVNQQAPDSDAQGGEK